MISCPKNEYNRWKSKLDSESGAFCETFILTETVSSGWCMVMQSMLIWMVFPVDPSVGLSVKFSSMGWTEWMADLKPNRPIWTTVAVFFVYSWNCLFYLLVQHIKQLVKHILAGEVGLCWLILGHGSEERAVPPGQPGCRVPQSAEWQCQLKSSFGFKTTCTRCHCAFSEKGTS